MLGKSYEDNSNCVRLSNEAFFCSKIETMLKANNEQEDIE